MLWQEGAAWGDELIPALRRSQKGLLPAASSPFDIRLFLLFHQPADSSCSERTVGAAASTRSISIPAHSGLWGREGDGNRLGLEQRGGKVMWRWDVTPVPSQSSFFPHSRHLQGKLLDASAPHGTGGAQGQLTQVAVARCGAPGVTLTAEGQSSQSPSHTLSTPPIPRATSQHKSEARHVWEGFRCDSNPV